MGRFIFVISFLCVFKESNGMVSSQIEISLLGSGDVVETNDTLQSYRRVKQTNKQANPTTCQHIAW